MFSPPFNNNKTNGSFQSKNFWLLNSRERQKWGIFVSAERLNRLWKTTKLTSFPFYAHRNLRDAKQNSGTLEKMSCLYVDFIIIYDVNIVLITTPSSSHTIDLEIWRVFLSLCYIRVHINWDIFKRSVIWTAMQVTRDVYRNLSVRRSSWGTTCRKRHVDFLIWRFFFQLFKLCSFSAHHNVICGAPFVFLRTSRFR